MRYVGWTLVIVAVIIWLLSLVGIGYMGDEDLTFDSNLEDVSSLTMKRWWIELTMAEKTITFTPGMFKAKSLASQIENAMEAKAS